MHSIRLTPAAAEQLKAIWRYSAATWDDDRADAYLLDIDAALQALAKSPKLGRARPEIHEGYHSMRVRGHVVFYLIDETHIDVIGVLHERMDVERHLAG